MGANSRPEHLTGVEALAVLAILRGAKERLDAQQRPPVSSRLTCCWDRPGLSSGRAARCSRVLLPGLLQTDLRATREGRVVDRKYSLSASLAGTSNDTTA